jgi:hypothetical protein
MAMYPPTHVSMHAPMHHLEVVSFELVQVGDTRALVHRAARVVLELASGRSVGHAAAFRSNRLICTHTHIYIYIYIYMYVRNIW